MSYFHSLKVSSIKKETTEAVIIEFDVPKELQKDYFFNPGQHLTLKTDIDGAEVRRSYSICAAPFENKLKVAVKKLEGGLFSNFANSVLKKGHNLDVMTPMGKFSPKISRDKKEHYLLVAAGSGITPIISIMKTLLKEHPNCMISLIFGNRSTKSVMFKEEIEDLKNMYLGRINIFFVLSREKIDAPLLSGRIDTEKCNLFFDSVMDISTIDEAFICGPDKMVFDVKESLLAHKFQEKKIHTELFTTPGQNIVDKTVVKKDFDPKKESLVTIRLNSQTIEFPLKYGAETVLDAALDQGADLPFACKGGVCCTCRAKLVEGEVDMMVNYGLEPDEIEAGFILTCQSHPRSEKIVVDFDQK